MLRDRAEQTTHQLTCAQLVLFHALSDEISLTEYNRRLILDMDEQTWLAWTAFLSGGPLPAEPPLPEMLRRLSESVFNLAMMADRRCQRLGGRQLLAGRMNADGPPG
jgi:hypothetical protein